MFKTLSIAILIFSGAMLLTKPTYASDSGYYSTRLPDADGTGHNPKLEIDAYTAYIEQTNPHVTHDVAYTIAETAYWAARDEGVDPSLVFAVMQTESTYNPNARNGGCYGLLQVGYQVHRRHVWRIEREYGVKSILDPRVNIKVGVQLLGAYIDNAGGNVVRGLLHYNGALRWNTYPGKVLRTQKRIRDFVVAYALVEYQPAPETA